MGQLVSLFKINRKGCDVALAGTSERRERLHHPRGNIAKNKCLFPFDRGRRFRADIINYTIDTLNFVDYAAADGLEDAIGKFKPIGRHEIFWNIKTQKLLTSGFNSSQGNHLIIRSLVAHHAHRFNRQQSRVRYVMRKMKDQ